MENFEIIRSLGVGATAEVHKAHNKTTDTYVALKNFSSFVSKDEEALKRLQDEVQILRSLDHPNIVKMLGEYRTKQGFCLELELVEGTHLRDWMKNYNIDLYEPKLWLLVQIARGLGAAHEKGIIHRDLKPENILISNQGDAKLSDFGLAKELGRLTMTRLGLLVGSLGYMAPEVVDGKKADTSADIFSFGTIAYEILAGNPVFNADAPQSLLKQIVDQKAEPLSSVCPNIPHRITSLIDSCLEKDPSLRPESIWLIEAEIMGYLSKTRLVPLCQKLCAASVDKQVLSEALKLKHASLLRRKEKYQNDPKTQKSAIINLANEFRTIFPDDPTATELLELLNQRDVSRRQVFTRRVQVLIGLLVFVIFGALVYHNLDMFSPKEDTPLLPARKPVIKVPVVPVKPVVNTKPKIPVSKPKPAIKKPVVVSKPKPKPVSKPKPKPVATMGAKIGTIQFFVDDGVEVYVNNKLVPYEELTNYKMKPGLHNLKLVKPGYLPVTSKVRVRPGKVTQIRAKGGR